MEHAARGVHDATAPLSGSPALDHAPLEPDALTADLVSGGEATLPALRALRTMLCVPSSAEEGAAVVEAPGGLPALLAACSSDSSAVAVEALWVLTNYAANASENVQVLIDSDTVPLFVRLLESPHQDVMRQAAWVIGNVSGDGICGRDAVLSAGAIPVLVRCVYKSLDLSAPVVDGVMTGSRARSTSVTVSPISDARRNTDPRIPPSTAPSPPATPPAPRPLWQSSTTGTGLGEPSVAVGMLRLLMWVLRNLCAGQPDLDVGEIIATVAAVVQATDDIEVLVNLCWCLANICDDLAPEAVIASPTVCGHLVNLLGHLSATVVQPALRAVGNIVADDRPELTDAVVAAGATHRLTKLLGHYDRDIQRKACWALSNLAAGTESQLSAVLSCGCLPTVLALVNDLPDLNNATEEACWVVLNATTGATLEQAEVLVDAGCVPLLCRMLPLKTVLALPALEALERVLAFGDQLVAMEEEPRNPFVDAVDADAVRGVAASNAKARALADAYFAVCGLCRQVFTQDSAGAALCEACKCAVCASCDCSQYHMAAQEAVWAEDIGPEPPSATSTTSSSKQARRSRRKQARRRKARQAKAAGGPVPKAIHTDGTYSPPSSTSVTPSTAASTQASTHGSPRLTPKMGAPALPPHISTTATAVAGGLIPTPLLIAAHKKPSPAAPGAGLPTPTPIMPPPLGRPPMPPRVHTAPHQSIVMSPPQASVALLAPPVPPSAPGDKSHVTTSPVTTGGAGGALGLGTGQPMPSPPLLSRAVGTPLRVSEPPSPAWSSDGLPGISFDTLLSSPP